MFTLDRKTDRQTDRQTDGVIPIYPPNFVCGGYKKYFLQPKTAPFCCLFYLLDFKRVGKEKKSGSGPAMPSNRRILKILKGEQPLMIANRSGKVGAALKWPKIMGKIIRRKGGIATPATLH